MTPDDNLTEYADPALYDLENHDFEPDGPFYLALAQRFGGPVLELGCGTGRLTLPLAQHGLNMTGLDLVPAMLARARHKAGALPITWVEADVRRFDLEQRFGFIFEAGAAFQHMLTDADQAAFLTRVLAHLQPGGYCVIGASVPTDAYLADEPDEQDWFTYTGPAGQTVRVSGTQHYDPQTQIKTETAIRRWETADGQTVERVAPLQLRQWPPEQLPSLLREYGLAVREQYGAYDFSTLAGDSPHQLYVCQAAR